MEQIELENSHKSSKNEILSKEELLKINAVLEAERTSSNLPTLSNSA